MELTPDNQLIKANLQRAQKRMNHQGSRGKAARVLKKDRKQRKAQQSKPSAHIKDMTHKRS
jgi:hypothetical protein